MDLTDVANSGLTKKELLQLDREKIKLDKTLGGIRDMVRTPQAVWIVDTKKEHLAVDEARKLHIPVVGILDTNCDPDEVDYAVPGNDDAIRSVALLTRIIADAAAEGLLQRSQGGATAGSTEAEPMAEWERELLGAAAVEPTTSEAEALEGSDVQGNQLVDEVEGGIAQADAVEADAPASDAK